MQYTTWFVCLALDFAVLWFASRRHDMPRFASYMLARAGVSSSLLIIRLAFPGAYYASYFIGNYALVIAGIFVVPELVPVSRVIHRGAFCFWLTFAWLINRMEPTAGPLRSMERSFWACFCGLFFFVLLCDLPRDKAKHLIAGGLALYGFLCLTKAALLSHFPNLEAVKGLANYCYPLTSALWLVGTRYQNVTTQELCKQKKRCASVVESIISEYEDASIAVR